MLSKFAVALYDLKTTSLGGWWVVYNYTNNKAISAPSWGLAGWLWLSLAKEYGILDAMYLKEDISYSYLKV